MKKDMRAREFPSVYYHGSVVVVRRMWKHIVKDTKYIHIHGTVCDLCTISRTRFH
jgi:hypothetical protein